LESDEILASLSRRFHCAAQVQTAEILSEMPNFIRLSGYRVMWVMTLFDLPVVTSEERRRAAKFREFLLDQGFCMMQLPPYEGTLCAG